MAKIMVVDDNQDIVTVLETIVQKMGHTTANAYNGRQFLDQVEESDPDLVLLDVMMPGMKTREILNELEEMGHKDLKIILVTVVRFSEEEINDLKSNHNIVDYVKKPFDVADVQERIENSL